MRDTGSCSCVCAGRVVFGETASPLMMSSICNHAFDVFSKALSYFAAP